MHIDLDASVVAPLAPSNCCRRPWRGDQPRGAILLTGAQEAGRPQLGELEYHAAARGVGVPTAAGHGQGMRLSTALSEPRP